MEDNSTKSIPFQTYGKTPFRSINGAYLTEALFWETRRGLEDTAMYSLRPFDREIDGKFYPSLKKLYLEMEDITEYDFACKYLEGYEHWQALTERAFFKEYVEQWRKELILKIKARALKNMVKDSVDGKYEANKFLITNGWVDKDEAGKKIRGRPSKDEVKQELMKQAEVEKDLMDDLKRLKELN